MHSPTKIKKNLKFLSLLIILAGVFCVKNAYAIDSCRFISGSSGEVIVNDNGNNEYGAEIEVENKRGSGGSDLISLEITYDQADIDSGEIPLRCSPNTLLGDGLSSNNNTFLLPGSGDLPATEQYPLDLRVLTSIRDGAEVKCNILVDVVAPSGDKRVDEVCSLKITIKEVEGTGDTDNNNTTTTTGTISNKVLENLRDLAVAEAQEDMVAEQKSQTADGCRIKGKKGVIIDMNSIMHCFENRNGIDPNDNRRSKRQQAAPAVTLSFSNNTPKKGEKVTAIAEVTNFQGMPEDLYYNWFLIHTNEDGDPRAITVSRDNEGVIYDVNENLLLTEPIDPEDPEYHNGIIQAQIEAMKIVARGGYDRALFGEPKRTDEADPTSPLLEGEDRDGYIAKFGGHKGMGAKKGGNYVKETFTETGESKNVTCPVVDALFMDDEGYSIDGTLFDSVMNGGTTSNRKGVVDSGKITRCVDHFFGYDGYIGLNNNPQYSDIGRDLVIQCQHKYPAAPVDPVTGDACPCSYTDAEGNEQPCYLGDGIFSEEEEDCWGLDPTNADTDGDGVNDEADLIGLNQKNFTWKYRKGDKVGVIVEGLGANIKESSMGGYKQIQWATLGVCETAEDASFILGDGCDDVPGEGEVVVIF